MVRFTDGDAKLKYQAPILPEITTPDGGKKAADAGCRFRASYERATRCRPMKNSTVETQNPVIDAQSHVLFTTDVWPTWGCAQPSLAKSKPSE